VLIQEELTRILKNTKRKAKVGDYYILSQTQMPSVIVEIGFISNPREAGYLVDENYQSRVAYAIFSGIAKAQIQDYDEDIEKYPVIRYWFFIIQENPGFKQQSLLI
jgi:N-acetylmuramoyl-L-alanine amidase